MAKLRKERLEREKKERKTAVLAAGLNTILKLLTGSKLLCLSLKRAVGTLTGMAGLMIENLFVELVSYFKKSELRRKGEPTCT